jgi:hypothetical protein
VESIVIVVGAISLLSVVTLRESFAGAGADAVKLTAAGESLVAVHDWTFLFGPGFCVGVNGLLLGAYEQDGAQFLFSIPDIAFELSLTVYILAKGFRPSPILTGTPLQPRVDEGVLTRA